MSALAPARRTPITQTVMRDEQIGAKHRLLVEYMLNGLSHASLCKRTLIETAIDTEDGPATLTRHPRPGEPLTLIQAADVLRIRKRTARSLSKQPAFQRLLAQETQSFRDGARARATQRMVALIDEPGQGKAADRKVQLQAAAMTLGEMGGGTSISITNTVGVALAPGYILDLEERDDERLVEHVP